jgi:hypothetical protein
MVGSECGTCKSIRDNAERQAKEAAEVEAAKKKK